MACGVPVVVSETTSLPEVCGDAGNYINPINSEDIAKTINRLLADETLRTEKKLLGLEQAKKFTWESAARVVITCLESNG
jgi:glycosyltransferase involved in cell wall biosynthesis